MEQMKRYRLITLLMIMTLLISTTGCIFQSKEHKLVNESSELLSKTLLDPDSMVIYDAYVNTEDDEEQRVLFHYGSKNEFGDMSEGLVVVKFSKEDGTKLYREYSQAEVDELEKKSDELIKDGLFEDGFVLTPDMSAMLSQRVHKSNIKKTSARVKSKIEKPLHLELNSHFLKTDANYK